MTDTINGQRERERRRMGKEANLQHASSNTGQKHLST